MEKYRYALRNQKKIEKHYSSQILYRINESLGQYFKKGLNKDDIKRDESNKYDILIIDDVFHSCGLIVFYIIDKKFDVFKLAFKEFIN